MNVLLTLYQDFRCNSANHVDGVARELVALGCDCIAAAPHKVTTAKILGRIPYKTASFDQVENGSVRFDNQRGPDIVHFWTPREINRRFWVRLRRRYAFATIIHLEDNEELIAVSQLGQEYKHHCHGRSTTDYPTHLSHPIHSRDFLRAADGLSIIIESLAELIPAGKSYVLAWPSTHEEVFKPRPIDPALRRKLGITPNTIVLAYHGNIHQANFREVRSLYLAVALLNREGRPAALLRMGHDHIELSPDYRAWSSTIAKSFGFVPNRTLLAQLLSQADLFVQPGLCDDFNKYRFPSKIPDFLALARPVILPRTNIGLVTRHLQDAYVVEQADGPTIADAVVRITSDRSLYERLARGARDFFTANLRWSMTAGKIHALYSEILQARRKNFPGASAGEGGRASSAP